MQILEPQMEALLTTFWTWKIINVFFIDKILGAIMCKTKECRVWVCASTIVMWFEMIYGGCLSICGL